MRVSLSEWDFRHILQLTISESSLTEYQIGLVRERVGDLFSSVCCGVASSRGGPSVVEGVVMRHSRMEQGNAEA